MKLKSGTDMESFLKCLGRSPDCAVVAGFVERLISDVDGFLSDRMDAEFSVRRGRIIGIIVYGPAVRAHQIALTGYQCFVGEIPFGLTLEDSRSVVIEKLGQPSDSYAFKPPDKPPMNVSDEVFYEYLKIQVNAPLSIECDVYLIDKFELSICFDTRCASEIFSIRICLAGKLSQVSGLMRQEQFAKALELIEPTLEKLGGPWLQTAAECCHRLGRLSESERYYLQAIEALTIEGHVIGDAQYGYALLLADCGRWAESAQVLRRYLQKRTLSDVESRDAKNKLREIESKMEMKP